MSSKLTFIQTSTHKELLDTLQKNPDGIRRQLSEALRELTVLKVEEKKLSLRNIILLEQERHLRKENNKLKDESSHMQASVTQRIGYLQRYKVKNIQKSDTCPRKVFWGFFWLYMCVNEYALVCFLRVGKIPQCLSIKPQHIQKENYVKGIYL